MSNLLYPSRTACEAETGEASVPDQPDAAGSGDDGSLAVCRDEGVVEIHGPPEPPQGKPKRPPSQIEWVCIWLESALGASEELADLTEDMRFRLYGQGDDYRDPGDIPPDTAILPRLHILATRLQQQALRAEANLADIAQIA